MCRKKMASWSAGPKCGNCNHAAESGRRWDEMEGRYQCAVLAPYKSGALDSRMVCFLPGTTQAVRSTALIKVISRSGFQNLPRSWIAYGHFTYEIPPPQTSIPYPSLFRSAARDQISQSKCPYAKTVSKIGENFEMTLIKAVARTDRGLSPVCP